MQAGSKQHWKTAPEGAVVWVMSWGWAKDWICVKAGHGEWSSYRIRDESGATYTGDWRDSLLLRPTEEHEIGRMVKEMDIEGMFSGTTEIQIRKQHALAFPVEPPYRAPTANDKKKPIQVRNYEDSDWVEGIFAGFVEDFDTEYRYLVRLDNGRIAGFRYARIIKDGE